MFHLLCLEAGRGEGLQEVFQPGPGALSLGVELIQLPFQSVLGLRLLLQTGLQVPVPLYQVVCVLQEIVGSDALSAHRRQQITEGFHSFTGTRKEINKVKSPILDLGSTVNKHHGRSPLILKVFEKMFDSDRLHGFLLSALQPLTDAVMLLLEAAG